MMVTVRRRAIILRQGIAAGGRPPAYGAGAWASGGGAGRGPAA
ncbi:UNVERIFIED_ORG: hypothetical protein FHR35_003764 [Microbispora rosea subsp. rosea]